MERRIMIGDLTYICNVTHDDEFEYWNVSNADKLTEYLLQNGYKVEQIHSDCHPQQVVVKRGIRIFERDIFFLDQCEGDLIDWIKDSLPNTFTYYYDKVVFVTDDNVIAAYRDDIDNYWII